MRVLRIILKEKKTQDESMEPKSRPLFQPPFSHSFVTTYFSLCRKIVRKEPSKLYLSDSRYKVVSYASLICSDEQETLRREKDDKRDIAESENLNSIFSVLNFWETEKETQRRREKLNQRRWWKDSKDSEVRDDDSISFLVCLLLLNPGKESLLVLDLLLSSLYSQEITEDSGRIWESTFYWLNFPPLCDDDAMFTSKRSWSSKQCISIWVPLHLSPGFLIPWTLSLIHDLTLL